MDRLSGDQNGDEARSVPANGRTSEELSDRTHNRDWPADLPAKTIVSPSGEIASDESLLGGV